MTTTAPDRITDTLDSFRTGNHDYRYGLLDGVCLVAAWFEHSLPQPQYNELLAKLKKIQQERYRADLEGGDAKQKEKAHA